MGLFDIDAVATGARIKELRKLNHVTVAELAEYMNFESEQAIYKWQRGDSLPTLNNIFLLSQIFNTPIDEIIIGYNEKEKDNEPSLFDFPDMLF